MGITIELPDHEIVLQKLFDVTQKMEPKLDTVLKHVAMLMEGTLKMLIRQETHGSGLTAASVETRKEDYLTYGVGSYTRGNILRFLDTGTGLYRTGKPIIITPSAAMALHFFAKETGDEVFAMYCIVKGIIPFEFMDRTVQTHLHELDETIKNEIGGI